MTFVAWNFVERGPSVPEAKSEHQDEVLEAHREHDSGLRGLVGQPASEALIHRNGI
jgi:hypothetical protein